MDATSISSLRPAGRLFLSDLARNFRAITWRQLEENYTPDGDHSLAAALADAQRADLVTTSIEIVKSWQGDGGRPLASVGPGEHAPSAGTLKCLALARWGQPGLELVVRGTAKLSLVYGGEYRPVPNHLVSHEIALTTVFLAHLASDHRFGWSLQRSAPGGACPDAVAGEIAVEVLGAYSSRTILKKISISARMRLELY
jgi:hypothetical protein